MRSAQDRTVRAEALTLGYRDRTIVDGLDLELLTGGVTVIVGANGCGKSTLLRGLGRLLAPAAGTVTLDGRPLAEVPARELARSIGMLPQQPIAPEGITVGDLIGRGRYPHQGLFRRWSAADDDAVQEALRLTDTADLADRAVGELSGGQRQRVWIALALAQDADVMLLDEPTTFLDVAHQLEVLDLLLQLNREHGRTVVMVLHDLNLAARYADRLVVMHEGRIVAEGAPEDVVTPEIIETAFGLPNRVVADPVCGSPMVVPIGRFHGV